MNETLRYIAEELSEKYGIEIMEATKIVDNSFIVKAIYEMPDYIQHYDAEYWADEIMKTQSVR